MDNFKDIKVLINNLNKQSRQLNSVFSSIKEDDNFVKIYLNNLKKMSLQALDISIGMERQFDVLINQKTISEKKKLEEKNKKERVNGK